MTSDQVCGWMLIGLALIFYDPEKQAAEFAGAPGDGLLRDDRNDRGPETP